jgi:hypothetical protein
MRRIVTATFERGVNNLRRSCIESAKPLAVARREARRPVSCHHPVLEVRDARRLDCPDLLKLHLRVPEVVEEASTVA